MNERYRAQMEALVEELLPQLLEWRDYATWKESTTPANILKSVWYEAFRAGRKRGIEDAKLLAILEEQ